MPLEHRSRVLRAATTSFLARGYASSVDDIARRAGVAKQTVYAHFPSKDALFKEVAHDLTRRVLVELEAEPHDSQRTRQMIAWILAMAAGIVLLGFEIGSALLTFAFLRFAARERVWLSLTLAIATFLFFYVVFDRGLNIPFPPGLLTGWK